MLLDLHLTNACNLRCKYCYFTNKNKKEANLDLIQKTLEYFLNLEQNDKTLYCTFIGGEPTLKFDRIINGVEFGKKLARKSNKKIFFNLVTNGTNLDVKKIDFLKRNNFYIVLSFDGKKETQDFQRTFPDGRSCFRLAESTLDQLIKKIPTFSVRMTVTPAVASNLYENIKYFFSKEVNLIGIVPTYEDNWPDESLSFFKENFKNAIKMWNENIKKRPQFYILPLLDYLKSWRNKDFYFRPYMHVCNLNRGLRYSVSVEGDIYSCHRFTSIGGEEFNFGNVLNGGIEPTSEEEFYGRITKVRKKLKSPGCIALNYGVNKNMGQLLPNYQKFKDLFLELLLEMDQDLTYKNFFKEIKDLYLC